MSVFANDKIYKTWILAALEYTLTARPLFAVVLTKECLILHILLYVILMIRSEQNR